GEAEPLLGQRDLTQECIELASSDGPQPRRCRRTDGKRKLPLIQAELERQVEDRTAVRHRMHTGRCHGHAPFKGNGSTRNLDGACTVQRPFFRKTTPYMVTNFWHRSAVRGTGNSQRIEGAWRLGRPAHAGMGRATMCPNRGVVPMAPRLL